MFKCHPQSSLHTISQFSLCPSFPLDCGFFKDQGKTFHLFHIKKKKKVLYSAMMQEKVYLKNYFMLLKFHRYNLEKNMEALK